MIGREVELSVIDEVLDRLAAPAFGLVVEGEAGIGKTTLWQEALLRAQERGIRVLSCRPAEGEARLAYAGLTDLFAQVGERELAGLPAPQRRALAAALLRVDPEGVVEQRAVSAAVASLLAQWAGERGLLVAVDDVQWLDRSTARVLAFAVRRLDRARMGFLVSLRSGVGIADPLGLSTALGADAVVRLRLAGLSLGALRELLAGRLPALSRPLLMRIARTSGGNPFFALELARALEALEGPHTDVSFALPQRLGELVSARLRRLPASARDALATAAALASPKLTLLARAGCGIESLEAAQRAGIVEALDGRVWFTHPLLAAGVYSSLPQRRRRELHRRLAGVVREPEERARHLALAATGPDERVARVLERAAGRVRARGAPLAAAELVEQALVLTPASRTAGRRRRTFAAAEDYFYAGDRSRARSLLEEMLSEVSASPLRAEALRLLAEVHYYDDSWPTAVPLLQEARELTDDPGRRVRIEIDLAYALFNLGDPLASERLIGAALSQAAALDEPGLLARALGAQVAVMLVLGRGVDEATIERALRLEDWEERTVLPLRPSWFAGQSFLILGRLERAHEVFASLRLQLLERGLDSDLPATAWLTVWTECLRGDLATAELLAEEAVEGSRELESRTARALAMAARGLVGAYRGRTEDARRDCEEALELMRSIGWTFGTLIPLTVLGFLALSIGDVAEVNRVLGPLAEQLPTMGLTEPMVFGPFLPDELEALIAAGQLEPARGLLDELERQGRTLDRPWALATGGRCRALLLAADGELDAASATVERALAEHRRLEMPFELARTLLVRGGLQRRRRQKRLAKDSLEAARDIFERLGTPLWTAKADAELARLGLRRRTQGLSETEQRVSALAAEGLTNRAIAAQLFISPKTVQAHLTRVYAQLGIHSRAQLGAHMAHVERQQS